MTKPEEVTMSDSTIGCKPMSIDSVKADVDL